MIWINLNIENPWSDRFDIGRCWFGAITENKSWELQAYRNNSIVIASVEITHKRDHAGIRLEFGIASFSLIFQIYDNRHWNNNKNCWES